LISSVGGPPRNVAVAPLLRMGLLSVTLAERAAKLICRRVIASKAKIWAAGMLFPYPVTVTKPTRPYWRSKPSR
jgi:hypothetical protein